MKIRDRIIEKYEGVCQMCNKKTNNNSLKDLAEIDHLIPKSRGGDGGEENRSLLCGDCNRKKSNNFGTEFLTKLVIQNRVSVDEYELMQILYEYKEGVVSDKDIHNFKKEIIKNTEELLKKLPT